MTPKQRCARTRSALRNEGGGPGSEGGGLGSEGGGPGSERGSLGSEGGGLGSKGANPGSESGHPANEVVGLLKESGRKAIGAAVEAIRENPLLAVAIVVILAAGAGLLARPHSGHNTRPAARKGAWQLVWSDEFDGDRLDGSKWVAKNDTSVDYDRACITDRHANVFVRDGMATLRARKEDARCGSQDRPYTTAYLTTQGRQSFTYGRFEIRARTPTGPTDSTGLWPAFWLRPDDGGKGEIDVVELPGGANYYRAATQAIFYDYTPVKQDHRYTFTTGYPADGFHTYVTEWDPGVLRWYIDGVLVYERDRSTTPWFDEALSRPFHLLLNFQVGGWLGDPDASTRFPADFQIDYVRVYQRT